MSGPRQHRYSSRGRWRAILNDSTKGAPRRFGSRVAHGSADPSDPSRVRYRSRLAGFFCDGADGALGFATRATRRPGPNFSSTVAWASRMNRATSSHFRSRSSRTPSQPRCPTYGGRKNRSGSASTIVCCTPSVAAHQIASRPSSWWLSNRVTNCRFSRTYQLGVPCERRSELSGSARHSARTLFSAGWPGSITPAVVAQAQSFAAAGGRLAPGEAVETGDVLRSVRRRGRDQPQHHRRAQRTVHRSPPDQDCSIGRTGAHRRRCRLTCSRVRSRTRRTSPRRPRSSAWSPAPASLPARHRRRVLGTAWPPGRDRPR